MGEALLACIKTTSKDQMDTEILLVVGVNMDTINFRSIKRLTLETSALKSLYGGQNTLSTVSIKPNIRKYCCDMLKINSMTKRLSKTLCTVTRRQYKGSIVY